MQGSAALALWVALGLPAAAQTAWPQQSAVCRQATACVEWYGTATTDSTGKWSVSFSSGTFTTTPMVLPQAVSADATLANSATASLTAQSSTGASGFVTLPATIVVGGMAIKAAGAGITVDVVAVGY